MKIRAAVLNAIGAKAPYAESKPLTIEEVELAGPGHGEVLVKIGAAGLCHSDLSVINGDRPRPMPMALGHEAAGVVEELGEGITDLQRGDHVVLVFVPSCGHCGPCAEGRPALCEPGAAANGAGTLAFRRDGASAGMAKLLTIISGVRCSRSTPRSRDARSSRSIASCRSTRQRYLDVRCSPASVRSSIRRRCAQAHQWR